MNEDALLLFEGFPLSLHLEGVAILDTTLLPDVGFVETNNLPVIFFYFVASYNFSRLLNFYNHYTNILFTFD